MKYLYPILFAFIFFSCRHNDISNISIQGTVQDVDSDAPIADASVEVISWKYENSPDESYLECETKIVTTDSKGKYQVHFDKGAFVEIHVSSDGYTDGQEAKEIYKKENTINILLQKTNE